MPAGVREFKTRRVAWLPYVFGGCFGGMGLLFAIIGIGGMLVGGGAELLLFALMGTLFVFIGIGIPVGIYFFGKTYTITCRPDGFTVRTENKRTGTEQREYRWEDVSSTSYQEWRSRSRNRRGGQTQISFIAETNQGRAFSVGREIGDLPGLIHLFNAMTPHLPYTWEPQAGFSVNVGIFSAGRNAYTMKPRNEAAPAPEPPPAPGPVPAPAQPSAIPPPLPPV
jgi:hypothetical protein